MVTNFLISNEDIHFYNELNVLNEETNVDCEMSKMTFVLITGNDI